MFFSGACDHASGANVELRSMPRALHGATDYGAIRKRPTFVCAVVAECHDALGTTGYRNTLRADVNQHGLAFAKFSLVAHRAVKTFNRSLLQLSCIGIKTVDADLVAIDERAAEPSGVSDREHTNPFGNDGEFVGKLASTSTVCWDEPTWSFGL